MSRYVLLSELTEGGVDRIKEDPALISDVEQEVEALGGEIIEQYALLGSFDFLTILEAPDNETVARVSVELGTRLNATSQTLAAIPVKDFVTGMK